MAVVRMFAAARAAAGRGSDELPGATVADVLAEARRRYGAAFADVLANSRVWVNGEPATDAMIVTSDDEVAVLPPVSGGADLRPLPELRARRDELQAIDDAVSYVRRVAQGRADLARDAMHRYSDDGDPTPVYIRPDLESGLRDVLSDRLLGGGDRPPRPAEDFSDHPLSAELDALCAEHGFSRLDVLDYDELETLVARLDAFEQHVSAQRREVFAELDSVTDEIAEHYRTGGASA
ncbi:MoaD/ThiS family protein [Desertimonas flava]|uniref:RsiG family protein n=1 Tax=Desertimonas flava TaxID=2064846 RepID=UPI0013C45E5E|nr:MoaD/ThiS family protein [Desertimonas flava]